MSTISEAVLHPLPPDAIVAAVDEDRRETGEERWRALVLLTTLQQFENGWRSFDESAFKSASASEAALPASSESPGDVAPPSPDGFGGPRPEALAGQPPSPGGFGEAGRSHIIPAFGKLVPAAWRM